MSDILLIASPGLLFLGLWIVLGFSSASRPLGDVAFRDRALAMCFVTAPIMAPVVLLAWVAPLITFLPKDAWPVAVGGGVVVLLAMIVGGPFVLWELSKTRPSMQRLWKIAARSREMNLEAK